MVAQVQSKKTAEPEHQPVWNSPQANTSGSILAEFFGMWKIRHLIRQMVKRNFVSRYKGSLLGALWPLLNPLGHMVLYTFLFGIILQVRFTPGAGMSNFALYLMAGLLPWTAMSEAIASSTTKILEVPNLVKKVVFPLQILPLVETITAFLNGSIALCLLTIVAAFYIGQIHLAVAVLPLIILPHFLFTAGIAWFLASIGVFIRDAKHIIALALSAWMYATPIIYPADRLPENLKFIIWINPVAGIIEDYRHVILEGKLPELVPYLTYTGISIIVCLAGFNFFFRTKKGFADVI